MKFIYFDLLLSLSFNAKRILCYLLKKKVIDYQMLVLASKINYFKNQYSTLNHATEIIELVKEFNINLIDLTASSFPGIGTSTKSGSQFVSKIEIIGIPNLRHSLMAVISRF